MKTTKLFSKQDRFMSDHPRFNSMSRQSMTTMIVSLAVGFVSALMLTMLVLVMTVG